MTREDIVRMALEVGFSDGEIDTYQLMLERFATLVASAESEVIAQMIEDAPALMEFAQNDQGGCLMCGFIPKLAAKTIRARGSNAEKN